MLLILFTINMNLPEFVKPHLIIHKIGKYNNYK